MGQENPTPTVRGDLIRWPLNNADLYSILLFSTYGGGTVGVWRHEGKNLQDRIGDGQAVW